jgi:hypothetical protein
MIQFVEELPLDFVERDTGELIANRLLKAWRESGGLLSNDMVEKLGHLVLLNGDPDFIGSPEILFAGRGALASELLGRKWAEDPKKAVAFDPKYRNLVGAGYKSAIQECRPVHDFVSVSMGNELLRYKRFVLPVFLEEGGSLLMCYSFDFEGKIRPLHFQSNIERQDDRILQSKALEDLIEREACPR